MIFISSPCNKTEYTIPKILFSFSFNLWHDDTPYIPEKRNKATPFVLSRVCVASYRFRTKKKGNWMFFLHLEGWKLTYTLFLNQQSHCSHRPRHLMQHTCNCLIENDQLFVGQGCIVVQWHPFLRYCVSPLPEINYKIFIDWFIIFIQ